MGFFEKIKAGMAKTRAALSNTLGGVFTGFSEIDDDFYDELAECLILADLGVETAGKAVERLKKTVREQHLKQTGEAREALRQILTDMLNVGDPELNLSTQPSVILVIGVNGVGIALQSQFTQLLAHLAFGGVIIGSLILTLIFYRFFRRIKWM